MAVCERFRVDITQAEYRALHEAEFEAKVALAAAGQVAITPPDAWHNFVQITTATNGCRPLPDLRRMLREQIAAWAKTPAGVEAVSLEAQLFKSEVVTC